MTQNWKQIADGLAQALRECASDLDVEVRARIDLPRRIVRDLEPVRNANVALAAYDAYATHQGSHWDTCYESHHDCAIARVKELEWELKAWNQAISEANWIKIFSDTFEVGCDWIEIRIAELLKELPHD